MATAKKKAPTKKGDVVTGLAPAKRDVHEVEILPSAEAEKAVALRDKASALTVVDQPSHTSALTVLRDVKVVKRAIEAHWKRMKDPLNNLLRHVRDLERGELEPTEEAVRLIEAKTVPYEREARRLADELAEKNRKQAEADAADARRRELEDAEAKALAIEASSPNLSAREAVFVDCIVRGQSDIFAATKAQYADPHAAAARLSKTAKILSAINARQEALALREQAEARKAQPLDVEVVDTAPALGKVSGVRTLTTYTCEAVNLEALLEGWKAGIVPAEAFAANLPFLNAEAKRLKDAALFSHAYPGCRLGKRESHAG